MTHYYGSHSGFAISLDDLRDQAYNGQHDYRPTFVHRTLGEFDYSALYGLEFEFSFKTSDKRGNAFGLLSQLNQNKRDFYCKHDGSVHQGFECNTMPMSINYLRSLDGIAIQNTFNSVGVVPHPSCGFHIHICRDFINNATLFQQNFYRLAFFFLWLSGRTDLSHLDRYARLIAHDGSGAGLEFKKLVRDNVTSIIKGGRTTQHITSTLLNKMKLACDENRYTALNLRNEETIEIRIFNGVTQWAEALRYVEVVNWLVNISNQGVILNTVEDIKDYGLGHEYDNMINSIVRNYRKSKIGSIFVDNDFVMAISRKPLKRVRGGDLLLLKNKLDKISYEYTPDESLRPFYDCLCTVTGVSLEKGNERIEFLTRGGSKDRLVGADAVNSAIYFEEVNPLYVVEGRKPKEFLTTLKKAYPRKPSIPRPRLSEPMPPFEEFIGMVDDTLSQENLYQSIAQGWGVRVDGQLIYANGATNREVADLAVHTQRRIHAEVLLRGEPMNYESVHDFLDYSELTMPDLRNYGSGRDVNNALFDLISDSSHPWRIRTQDKWLNLVDSVFFNLFEGSPAPYHDIRLNMACMAHTGLTLLELYDLILEEDGNEMVSNSYNVGSVVDFIQNDLRRQRLLDYIDSIAMVGSNRHYYILNRFGVFGDSQEYDDYYGL